MRVVERRREALDTAHQIVVLRRQEGAQNARRFASARPRGARARSLKGAHACSGDWPPSSAVRTRHGRARRARC